MLCFVMALKSAAASANWSTVQRLFEQTLASVCSQTNADFCAIVVCDDKPTLRRPVHRSVHFLVQEVPVPGVKANGEISIEEVYRQRKVDKWTKLAHGLVLAGEFRPDFVMLMDADDLVSCRLADHANRNKASNGWILKNGYNWRYSARWMEYTDYFNCGTNAIVSSRLITFPKDVSNGSIQECVLLQSGHTTIEKTMQRQGTPLEPLPFPGAVYVRGHGDNDSGLVWPDPRGWQGLRFCLGSIRRSLALESIARRRFWSPWYKTEFGFVDRV